MAFYCLSAGVTSGLLFLVMVDDKQIQSIIRRIGLNQRIYVGLELRGRFFEGLDRRVFQHS